MCLSPLSLPLFTPISFNQRWDLFSPEFLADKWNNHPLPLFLWDHLDSSGLESPGYPVPANKVNTINIVPSESLIESIN